MLGANQDVLKELERNKKRLNREMNIAAQQEWGGVSSKYQDRQKVREGNVNDLYRVY